MSRMSEFDVEPVSDPFETIRMLSERRQKADWAWRTEVMNLRAAGYSTWVISQVAGFSHDMIWKIR